MITIVMTTYAPDDARAVCAQRVVQSLSDFLMCEEPIALHIADDGSEPRYTSDLVSYAEALGNFEAVTFTVANRLGIGGSLNRALRTITPELWLYITDDWLVLDYWNINKAVKLVREHRYDYVRLGPIHPGLLGRTKYIEGLEYFLELNPGFGGVCFATRPFLANWDFYSHMGPFPEKLDAYDTERIYAERARDRNARMAFCGLFDTRSLFEHIGDVSPVGKIKPS